MKVLIVATKAPWPAVDGGRVLLWNTLSALRESGVEVSLVAPGPEAAEDRAASIEALSQICVPYLITGTARSERGAPLRALTQPLTIARHTRPAVRAKVEELLAGGGFQVVHAEQLQALCQAQPATAWGIPVVLRAQNVESDLWNEWGRQTGGLTGLGLRVEGRRLAAWEGRAGRKASAVWALSPEDAGRLARLRGETAGTGPIQDRPIQGRPIQDRRIEVVRPPFSGLPEVPGNLEGSPSVVLMGSRGWRPNEDANRWFVEEVWPEVRRLSPGAVLHFYGESETGTSGLAEALGIRRHPAPAESREAFVRGSIQVVPLRVGSGVRIKILEAWARGIPVVGTPQAFSGLGVADREAGLIAGTGEDFASAIAALHADPTLRGAIVEGGRRKLLGQHSPAAIGRQMAEGYAALAEEAIRTRR